MYCRGRKSKIRTDNEIMKKQFILYRTQLLFTGLNHDEMMKVETVFNRYSVYYKNSLSEVGKLENFDLLCMTFQDFEKNRNTVLDSKVPFFILGEKSVTGCVGFISRAAVPYYWLEKINVIVPPVRTPTVEGLEIGVVVRSKTTPLFGRGVVTQLISSDEVMVKFPTTNLLAKDRAIRCHKSQLQILGKIEDF